MELSTYKCDGCGILRSNDTNHWWLGWADDFGVIVRPFNKAPTDPKEYTHLCGVQCALKWVTEQMNKITGGQTK